MSATEDEISGFLEQYKFFADAGGHKFIDRPKNNATFAELGISEPEALMQIIMQLEPTHYVKGPEQDRDYPRHDVWIFEYVYDGVKLYVKLSSNFKHGFSKCISLHE